MSLILGTNSGFVTEAPTSDPLADAERIDDKLRIIKDSTPAEVVRITEIGWWCDTATGEINFEVGLYSHNSGDDAPDALIGVSRTNAKGTTAGWKTVSVDWEISPNTAYWIAIQVDDTTPNTYINYATIVGERYGYSAYGTTTIPTTFVGTLNNGFYHALYALVEGEAPPATNMKINIGDVWKDVESMKINIGDVWKDVAEVKQNIGDAWKVVY